MVWNTSNNQKSISQSWKGTTEVIIIPIDVDKRSGQYIQSLTADKFTEIERYFDQQIKPYMPDNKYVINISVAEPINSIPPPPPRDRSKLSVMWWSLKLRWWTWQNSPKGHTKHQIRAYVLYQSPKQNTLLPHSLGLQKGLVGIIHARAFKRAEQYNNLVIAHELMHVFGATDKYNLATGLAIFPQGYVNPSLGQYTAQSRASLMGRTIPLNQGSHKVATTLRQTTVNKITATEIGWLK